MSKTIIQTTFLTIVELEAASPCLLPGVRSGFGPWGIWCNTIRKSSAIKLEEMGDPHADKEVMYSASAGAAHPESG